VAVNPTCVETMQAYLGSVYVNDFKPLRSHLPGYGPRPDAGHRLHAARISWHLQTRNGRRRGWCRSVACSTSTPANGPDRGDPFTKRLPPPAEVNGAPGVPGRQPPTRPWPRSAKRRCASWPAGHEVRVDRPHLPANPGGRRPRATCSVGAVLLVFLVLAAAVRELVTTASASF